MMNPGSKALERIIDTTQDAVVFIDAHSRIVRFNASASRIFGYSVDEVLDESVTLLMAEPYASEHAGYIARYEHTKDARAIGRIREVTGRRRSGEEFPIELSVTEVKDTEVRYAAIIRDVSKKAQLEQELLEKERMAAVGLLASMFAHEVGNPLNNMFIHAQMLKRKLARLDFEDQLGPGIELIMDELRRLTELLHEFRALYRPLPSTSLAPVSLPSLFNEVLTTLLVEPIAERIEVRREFDEQLPAVLGSADKLKQVFINLCKNAIEAMPEGGLLTIRARAGVGDVVVEICDTGVGIPPGSDPFEAFCTTKSEGSGLGLAVVRQIVTDHGGRVFFTSDLEQGTVFCVQLRATG
jgi:two-component system sensor kinase FixL